jgi:hypothetical protein
MALYQSVSYNNYVAESFEESFFLTLDFFFFIQWLNTVMKLDFKDTLTKVL